MIVELSSVEAYVEPHEILYQAFREGEITVRDVLNICEDEVGTEALLEYFSESDIQRYIEENDLDIRCSFKNVKNSLQHMNKEQRAELLWELLDIEDEEVEYMINTKIVIPKLKDFVNEEGRKYVL